jgi:RNA polymerase sigma-70 factor (ECF subfamily)
MTDDALLSAYRADGDNYWLGVLLQRYTALLLGVAMKYLKDRTKAEDAVQQVFIKVLTNFPAEAIHNFKGWLYILMRNHCLQQLRDKPLVPADIAEIEAADDQQAKDALLAQETNLQLLEEALRELGPEQKQTIELFYLKKYSYEQIIKATGYTFMQVKSYIQNGKRNLRTLLLGKMKQNR